MRRARSAATHSSPSTVRTRPTARRAWPADCQAKLACSSRPREIDTEPSTAGVAPVRRRASASPARYSAIISPELPSSAARNGVRPVRSGAIRWESRAPDEAAEGDERQPQAVERQRAARGVEAAVVQRLAAREQRVLGGGVDLDGEDVVQRGERVVQRAGHGRQAAQPERVLPPRGRLGAGGERAQPRRHRGQAGERAGGRDRARERLAVALQRREAQRGDADPGVQQIAQVRPHQRGGARRWRRWSS